MSGGLGIPLIDFSPLSRLGETLSQVGVREEANRLLSAQLDAAVGAQGQASNTLAPLGSAPLAIPGVPAGPAAPRMGGSLPTFARAQGAQPSANIRGLIADVATRNEISPDYLTKLVGIESSFNPNAVSSTGAKGLGQFIPSTAKAYGLTDPFDPAANLQATARFTLDNRATLARALGREPTAGELYLAHQQGAGGAAKILANPDATMGQLGLGRAASVNGGSANMRAGDFAAKWTSRFGDSGLVVASAAPQAPVYGMNPAAPRPAAPQPVAPSLPSPTMAGGFGAGITPTPPTPGGRAAAVTGVPAAQETATADLPIAGAREVQGFVVPGSGAGAPVASPDFVPGSVASPAIVDQRLPAANNVLQPQAAQRLSPQQAQNLRAMLNNPLTQGYAAKIIEGLNNPEEFSFQVVGDQLVRTSKSGRAEVVPNITKPVQYQTIKGSDGNDYVFNPQTGAMTRALQGRTETVRDLSADEKVARGIDPKAVVQVDSTGKLSFPGKAATEINIGEKADQAGDIQATKALMDRFAAVAQEGDQARSDVALVGELRALGNEIGTGGAAAIQGRLAEYGIKIGPNAGKIEAFNALVDRLTPQQRIPGAGATSDFDARMFKSSLPRLINSPEGNALIADTLEALAKDKAARGEIANQVQLGPRRGGISIEEGMRLLRAMPSVQTPFVQRMRDLQQSGQAGSGGASAPRREPQRIPAGMTPEQVRRTFPSGTEIILPDGRPGKVP